MKPKCKKIAALLMLAGTFSLTAMSASAQFLPGLPDIFSNDPFDDIFGDDGFVADAEQIAELYDEYQALYTRYEQMFKAAIDGNFGPLSNEIASILEDSLSELGIVDLEQANGRLRDLLNRANLDFDLYKPSVSHQFVELQGLINRTQAKTRARSVLSTEGQEAMMSKLETVQASTFVSSDLAGAAAGDIATQDVVKKLSSQMALNAQVLGALHTEVIDNRIDTQLQADVLTDIAQDLAAERKQETIARVAAVGSAFTAAQHYMLSVTPTEGE